MMIPRRYQKTILKLLLIIPLLWLLVTFFLSSTDHDKSDQSLNNVNSHKVKDKHKPDAKAQARVDLLRNSNRLGRWIENKLLPRPPGNETNVLFMFRS